MLTGSDANRKIIISFCTQNDSPKLKSHLFSQPGYFNFKRGGCDPCNCNPYGVLDGDQVCDPLTGQCNCKEGQNRVSSRTCDGCPEGFYLIFNNPMECFSKFSVYIL